MPEPPVPLYTAAEIQSRVTQLAASLDARFPPDEPLHLVAILKGSFVFLADLIRMMQRPVTVDFVRIASYGAGTETSGAPVLLHSPAFDLRNQHVVIVDDILDSGLTLQALQRHLRAADPRSLSSVVLLDKPTRRRVDTSADLVGFTVDDRFVVGYGLDHSEAHRQLPYLAVVPPS